MRIDNYTGLLTKITLIGPISIAYVTVRSNDWTVGRLGIFSDTEEAAKTITLRLIGLITIKHSPNSQMRNGVALT